ncbi:MAG: response regulator, partial [Candidatus Eisenbacteria sp.]|nr:response regulator [Candidatus Eisenbacteria bacterium]
MNRVLIVDDIPAMHEQYAYDLRRLGKYETLTACSGSQALEIVEHEQLDCMILDLEMPGMDGFEVLDALAKRGLDLPVIVYTATGNYKRCVRAVQLGAYGFIDKTESMERVVREIESAIERRRLASEVTWLRGLLGEDSPMIGESRVMQELRETIERVAPIPS